MSCCDVTAGHYYSQLMTTAHASCCWPAAARFTEHGQHARHNSWYKNSWIECYLVVSAVVLRLIRHGQVEKLLTEFRFLPVVDGMARRDAVCTARRGTLDSRPDRTECLVWRRHGTQNFTADRFHRAKLMALLACCRRNVGEHYQGADADDAREVHVASSTAVPSVD